MESEVSSSARVAASSALIPTGQPDSAQQQQQQDAIIQADAKGQTLFVHSYSQVTIAIQNVVSSLSLGLKPDLKIISSKVRGAEYNPERFSACIMRIQNPKTTALLFKSGKMVITGAKSVDDAKSAAKKFGEVVRKCSEASVKITEFKIQNMVGTCDVKFPVSLEKLALEHHKFSTYEPELFPGLIYRMKNPKLVILLFVTGRLVITGARSQKDIYDAFSKIYPVLVQFKKAPPASAASASSTTASSASSSSSSAPIANLTNATS